MHHNIIYHWARHIVGIGKIHKQIIVEADFKAEDKVIDVGCGMGGLLGTIEKQYRDSLEYMGIEPDENMLHKAQELYKDTSIKFKRAFANHLPSVQQYYSHVICMVSFHHFPQEHWGESLAELCRVLAPGGKLIIVDFGRPTGIIGRFLWLVNPCKKLSWDLEEFLKKRAPQEGLELTGEHKQFGYITHFVFTKTVQNNPIL